MGMMVGDRWTWHGGGIAAARAHFGEGAQPWIDLSTGINPHAWPIPPECEIDWQNLPDEGALRVLEEAAAAYFGCDADHVCALPGTEIGLRLLRNVVSGPAQYVVPTYRTHAAIIAAAQPVEYDRLADADGATLIIANPNNPDGRVVETAAFGALLNQRGKDGWLVIDEAFADTDPQLSLAHAIDDHRNLLIFRSFGKFFGLAGVRLGFVLGPPAILAQFRALLGAWPLSAAAITIGTAAYRDRKWIDTMRLRLKAEAANLDATLSNNGFKTKGYSPLFRLIIDDRAQALFTHLAEHAILTRPFDYAPNWLRVGLSADGGQLSRFDGALASYG